MVVGFASIVVVRGAVVVVTIAARWTGSPSPRDAVTTVALVTTTVATATAAASTARRLPIVNMARSESELGQHLLDVGVDRGARLDLGDRAVRVLQAVAGDGAHHHLVAREQSLSRRL